MKTWADLHRWYVLGTKDGERLLKARCGGSRVDVNRRILANHGYRTHVESIARWDAVRSLALEAME